MTATALVAIVILWAASDVVVAGVGCIDLDVRCGVVA